MPAYAITTSEMRQWERESWAAGQTEAAVIELVGIKIAAAALRLTRPGDLILVLAGKGNNGKDALAACPHMLGRDVKSLTISDPDTDRPRLADLLAEGPSLVIDGLFGIGLNRELAAAWVQILACINQAKCPVLSVDVPSGLNADTGEPAGASIEASLTLTVGAPKAGLLKTAAAKFVGRLEVASDVGLSPAPPRSEIEWVLPEDFKRFPSSRSVVSHKGSHGHLGIVAGSKGYHGAAVLCARGAQHARPGLITLTTLESIYVPVASQLQAVMVSTWNVAEFKNRTWDAVTIGPGLAGPEVPEDLKQFLKAAWNEWDGALVVDASALNWLPPGPIQSRALRVITPHPGEAGRMLETNAANVQSDRFAALRALSNAFGDTWVVLKGHQTLIGRSHGPIQVNSSGNPGLAQGGTGDLLAGFIAGLLAQPALAATPRQTLAYAVWEHGRTADALQASRTSWTSEDLASQIGSSPK